jgi:hypothetical protein
MREATSGNEQEADPDFASLIQASVTIRSARAAACHEETLSPVGALWMSVMLP